MEDLNKLVAKFYKDLSKLVFTTQNLTVAENVDILKETLKTNDVPETFDWKNYSII